MKTTIRKLFYLTLRDIKLYFKDRMTFFVSLITPMILLVLFVTFLKKTYEESILEVLGSFQIEDKVLNAFTGGWLFSSVLATSCVTVSFCSGMMTLDKISGADIDFQVAPISKAQVKIAYVLANLLSTLLVCFVLLFIGLLYLAVVGFYLTFVDVLLILANIFLTSLFATLVANILWSFTKSQGVVSGVCTLLSALYGFLCGAYMPIDSMGEGFAHFTAFLPGTYSTVLFRKAFLDSVLDKMGETLPSALVDGLAQGFDVDYSFFGKDVSTAVMFLIGISSVVLAFFVLVLISNIGKTKGGRFPFLRKR